MTKIIEAIYENGVFKPLQKVDLREKERVKLILKKVEVEKFVMARLSEEKIKELEERFESEDIY